MITKQKMNNSASLGAITAVLAVALTGHAALAQTASQLPPPVAPISRPPLKPGFPARPTQPVANSGDSRAARTSQVVVTGRFVASGAASATKQNVSTLDTPFSVSSYTGSFMKSIQTGQVADLYRYMTGLQKAGYTGYDLTLRGFSTSDSDRNTILVDGLPGLAVRFGSPPTVGTDHVEVVKGAASLLYGAVQPGGFVNMITKKPSADQSTELSIRGTEHASDRDDRTQGEGVSLDSTGPLTASRDLLYRFVGQITDDRYFRDSSYERGYYLMPSLTWNPTSKTSVTGQIEYRSVNTNYASIYLLAPRLAQRATVNILAPIYTYYSEDGAYLEERGLTESLFFSHEFAPWLKWNFSFRNVDHRDLSAAFEPTTFDSKDPTFQTLDLRARMQHNHRNYKFGDNYFTTKFETFGLTHRMIFGTSLGQEIDDFARLQYCSLNSPGKPKADPTCNPTSAQYTVKLTNPNFSNLPPLDTFGPGVTSVSGRDRNYIVGVAAGAYVSDLIGLGRYFKTSLGVRYAAENQRNFANLYVSGPVPGDAHVVSTAVLPQAGLIFEPTRHLSFYASYSTSFSPTPPGTQSPTGSFTFKPTTGDGYEVGAKGDLFGHRLTVTSALFLIDQNNLVVASSSSACSTGNCSDQIGQARSTGFELETSAQPLRNWTLIAGYAYTDAKVANNPDAGASGPLAGARLPNAPLNAAHIWSRYDVSEGVLRGLGAGIGYSYTGERVPYSVTTALPKPFTMPAYSLVDLALYYTYNHYNFTLKLNNVLDQNYYSSGTVTQAKVNIIPGAPRTIMGTLSYRF